MTAGGMYDRQNKAQYKKVRNRVYMQGLVRMNGYTFTRSIGYLAEGFYPTSGPYSTAYIYLPIDFIRNTDSGEEYHESRSIYIQKDGLIVGPNSNESAPILTGSWFSLDGITFSID